jgi:hypothetical protein
LSASNAHLQRCEAFRVSPDGDLQRQLADTQNPNAHLQLRDADTLSTKGDMPTRKRQKPT